jgi:hypothetical protein
MEEFGRCGKIGVAAARSGVHLPMSTKMVPAGTVRQAPGGLCPAHPPAPDAGAGGLRRRSGPPVSTTLTTTEPLRQAVNLRDLVHGRALEEPRPERGRVVRTGLTRGPKSFDH